MSDVIDVITRLSLVAETSGGEKQLAVIDANIKAVDRYDASLNKLEALKAKTDKNDTARIAKLNAAIANRKKMIEQEMVLVNKQIQTNEKLRNSLARQGIAAIQAGDRLDKFGRSSNSAAMSLMNLGRVAQDIPYGFMGIANNLNPLLESFQRLKAETGSTSGAMKALVSSLSGAGGVGLALSVVSSLLLVFGGNLFKATEEVSKGKTELDDYTKSIVELSDNISKEIVQFEHLTQIASNANVPYLERRKAVDKLQEQYPEFLENKSEEAILEGKVGDAYSRTIDLIIQRMRVKQEEAKLEKLISEKLQIEQKLEDFATGKSFNYVTTPKFSGAVGVNDPKADFEKRLQRINEEIARTQVNVGAMTGANPGGLYGALMYGNNQSPTASEGRTLTDIELDLNAVNRQIKTAVIGSAKYNELLKEQKRLQDEASGAKGKTKGTKNKDRLIVPLGKDEFDELGKDIEFGTARVDIAIKAFEDMLFNRELNKSDGDPFKTYAEHTKKALSGLQISILESISPGTTDAEADAIFESIRDAQISNETRLEALRDKVRKARFQKELTEEERLQLQLNEIRLKHTEDVIQSFNTVVAAALNAANAIYAIQLNQNEREIAATREKIEYATELAERGNTDLLNSEKARLDELQKKRDEIADRQLAVNAIIQASNQAVALSEAIGAVVKAAAQGDPYTIALRVAAAVAALIAGVTAIKQAFSVGFKDGVIDLQGPGTGKSDSIPARLSKGESVMTAEETKEHKDALKAMREGTFKNRFVPIEYMREMLPIPITYNYPTAQNSDIKSLKKEMVAVREAIENIHFNASQSMDEYGLSQVLETNARQNQMKFRKR